MDWLPNEDRIFYFANEIFPLIRRQVPVATLCGAPKLAQIKKRRLDQKGGCLPDDENLEWNPCWLMSVVYADSCPVQIL